jgi:hypothetical protein
MRSAPAAALFTTAITESELLYGIALLPEGRRQQSLATVVDLIFAEDLAGRVLPFDSAAAREFAEIAASRHRAGQPISQGDARIAAITRSHRAALAMRNVGDFAGCWLELIDPWVEPAASSSNAPANRSTSAPC